VSQSLSDRISGLLTGHAWGSRDLLVVPVPSGPPLNVRARALSADSVMVEWSPPAQPNGVLLVRRSLSSSIIVVVVIVIVLPLSLISAEIPLLKRNRATLHVIGNVLTHKNPQKLLNCHYANAHIVFVKYSFLYFDLE